MPTRGLRLSSLGVEFGVALLVAGVITLLAIAGIDKLGTIGLALPLAMVVGGVLIARPALSLSLLVGLVILFEGFFGLFTFTAKLYEQVYKDVSLLDLIVILGVAAVAVDVLRSGRPIWVPRALALPSVVLALGMIAGILVGHEGGASLHYAFFSEHVLFYLLFLPLAVANLDVSRRQLVWALGVLAALAVVKAFLGLVEVFGGYGPRIEGSSTLTYYEPAANWVVMVAALTIAALALRRVRAPAWVYLTSPLLIASLVLSYRRSFWIAGILGLLLVLLLGSTATTRKALLPAVLALAAAIWLLGSISFQSQSPLVKRLTSLSPTKLESNAEDRYRLDERANVWGEISKHPIAGIGVTIPWQAKVQPLSVEHEDGRQYVHFAALWFWLKMGILGLWAYIAYILAGIVVAFQAWRSSRDPLLRAFSLASLAAVIGLIAMDTTASFTGVDPRFTVLVAAQLGLLAKLKRIARDERERESIPAPLRPPTAPRPVRA
jgi:O-antigen ligase